MNKDTNKDTDKNVNKTINKDKDTDNTKKHTKLNSGSDSFVYALDRYTNKNIKVLGISEDVKNNLKHGDKIVYSMEDNNQKPSIWSYLWHDVDTDRLWHFTKTLKWEEKDFFEEQNKFALKIFPIFKRKFKKEFNNSIPVTARFHIYLDQLYFYF